MIFDELTIDTGASHHTAACIHKNHLWHKSRSNGHRVLGHATSGNPDEEFDYYMDVVQKNQTKSHEPLEKTLKDAQLVESAAGGNRVARETLAIAALPRVRKIVYFSYGNRPDHEDLVQIAMVTIFKDLPGLRDYSRFRPWMDTVVYNVVRAQGRKRMRFAAHFTTMETSDDSRTWDITPEDENMGEELARMLQKQLDKIAPKKRTAAVMSVFFGYVDSEVAQMMGCSVETAKKRIHYGRKELLEKVQRGL